jgi:hypothetical protein
MTELANKIIGMSLMFLVGDQLAAERPILPTGEQVRDAVDRLAMAFSVKEPVRMLVLQEVLARFLLHPIS